MKKSNKLFLSCFALSFILAHTSISCMEKENLKNKLTEIKETFQLLVEEHKKLREKKKKHMTILKKKKNKVFRLKSHIYDLEQEQQKLQKELRKKCEDGKSDEIYDVAANKRMLKVINLARKETKQEVLKIEITESIDHKQLGVTLHLSSINAIKGIVAVLRKEESTLQKLEKSIKKLTKIMREKKKEIDALGQEGNGLQQKLKELYEEERLERQKKEEEEGEEVKCGICKGAIEPSDRDVTFFMCGHGCHGACIVRWAVDHPGVCPQCGKTNGDAGLLREERRLLGQNNTEDQNEEHEEEEEEQDRDQNNRGRYRDDMFNLDVTQDPQAIEEMIRRLEGILNPQQEQNNRQQNHFMPPVLNQDNREQSREEDNEREEKLRTACELQEKLNSFFSQENNTNGNRLVDADIVNIAIGLGMIIDDFLQNDEFFGGDSIVNRETSQLLGMAVGNALNIGSELPEYIFEIFKKAVDSGLVTEFIKNNMN